MSEPKLLPCPFCGDTPNYESEYTFALVDGGYKYGAVECPCSAKGPDVRTGYQNWAVWRKAAAEAWNARAKPEHGDDDAVQG